MLCDHCGVLGTWVQSGQLSAEVPLYWNSKLPDLALPERFSSSNELGPGGANLPPASTVVDVWKREHGESHTSTWSFHISLTKASHMTTSCFKEASNLQWGRRKRQIRIFVKNPNSYHSIQEVVGNECSHVWLLLNNWNENFTFPSSQLEKSQNRETVTPNSTVPDQQYEFPSLSLCPQSEGNRFSF